VPEIVEVDLTKFGCRECRKPDAAAEVLVMKRPAIGLVKTSAEPSGATKVSRCSVSFPMITRGIATVLTPAADFGGPKANPPPWQAKAGGRHGPSRR
jgi:hypothetical protein